jgi:hypothetical protein
MASTPTEAIALNRQQSKFQWFSRLGYATRGVIYLIIGWLALNFALGQGGQAADSKEALQIIGYQRFGDILLGVVMVGFLAFALWRAVQAIGDFDDQGRSFKGLVVRAGLLGSAFVHLSLAAAAASIIFGIGRNMSSGNQEYSDWTGWLLAQPAGRWLVAGVGVIAIGAGVAHFIKAWRKDFLKYMDLSDSTERWVTPISLAGLISRGVVFFMIGWFLLVVAYTFDPSAARGLPGALRTLHQQAYGPWLLGVMAIGLFSFGLYSLIEAAFRRIQRTPGFSD